MKYINIVVDTLIRRGYLTYYGESGLADLKKILSKNGIRFSIELVDEKDIGFGTLEPVYYLKRL